MKSRCASSKTVFLFVLMVIGVFIATGIAQAKSKDVIKIGFSRSLSGWSAVPAKDEQEAVVLWSEEVNAKGGIYVEEYGKKLPVELVFYDDKSSPEEVVRIYERLITIDKVDVLFPPTQTPQNIATIGIAEKYRRPILAATCGSSKGKELGAKYWWAITPIGSSWMDKGHGLAGLINNRKSDIKNIAVLYLHEPFSMECHKAIMQNLKDLGINIAFEKDYSPDVKDLSGELLEIKKKDVDAFLGLSYPEDCFLIMKQSIEVGLSPNFMYFLLGPSTNAFQPIFKGATEGVMGMGMYCGALDYPGAKEFYQNMTKRWGHPPNLLMGADGYHAAQLMQQAIEKAGTLDPEKIRNVLATEEFMTIEGPVRLRNGINELAVPGVIQWQQGTAETVWPKKMATKELIYPKPAWP